MLFYLRVINPVISILVFLICTWSSIYYDSNSGINVFGIIAGSFPTYFFAKGLYTGGSLYLIGRILLEIVSKKECFPKNGTKRTDIIAFITFLTFTIGSLIGLYFWSQNINTSQKSEQKSSNPIELTIQDTYRVSGLDKIRIGGKIMNNSKSQWTQLKIMAKLYFGGKYSGKNEISIDDLGPNEEDEFMIDFTEFNIGSIADSITWKCEAEGSKKKPDARLAQ
jgi:hypothetical protein